MSAPSLPSLPPSGGDFPFSVLFPVIGAAAPLLGRLQAADDLSSDACLCLVFECRVWPGAYGALSASSEGPVHSPLVRRASVCLQVGASGCVQLVYVLKERRLGRGGDESLLAGLLAWYGSCLGAEDGYLGWVRLAAFGPGGLLTYGLSELAAGVQPDVSAAARLRRRALVRFLFERGAHFVLTNEDKSPLVGSKGWLERRAALGDVVRHQERGGFLGVVPASLGLSVLDVDQGLPGELVSAFPPALLLASRRRGGFCFRSS